MKTLNAEIKAKRQLLEESLQFAARIARELEGLNLLREHRAALAGKGAKEKGGKSGRVRAGRGRLA